jgi:hypothetical protein
MNKPNLKLIYSIGQNYTIGKPTQKRTGLGRIITIIGFTDDNQGVIVAASGEHTKTAKVKYSNIGQPVAADGTLIDVQTWISWKADPRC